VKPPPAHLAAGKAAEDAACLHLQAAGYRILCRNFRAHSGELDVVALDGPSLAVVEVRFRASRRFGGAAASITWRKRQRIVRATQVLLRTRRELARLPVRFDVVEVDGEPSPARCRLLRGAFSL
jgi:putative endonuclease